MIYTFGAHIVRTECAPKFYLFEETNAKMSIQYKMALCFAFRIIRNILNIVISLKSNGDSFYRMSFCYAVIFLS